MKKNTKRGLLVLVLLLAIGFAAVTTTLYINGTITLGENQDDFKTNLIFTKASLTYSDTTKTAIENVTGEGAEGDPLRILEAGKKISFTTDTLTEIGETVTLTYDITNNSQYKAEFTGISCTVKDGETPVTADGTDQQVYIKLTAKDFKESDTANKIIDPKGSITNHTLVIEQVKSFAGVNENSTDPETKTYTIECTINASGLSAGTTTTAAAGE